MNIICFSNTLPYYLYKWTFESFINEGYDKCEIQLIHPNIRYNGYSRIVICWFFETYLENKRSLDENNAFVILMDESVKQLAEYNIDIVDSHLRISKAEFYSIIINNASAINE